MPNSDAKLNRFLAGLFRRKRGGACFLDGGRVKLAAFGSKRNQERAKP
jgi:hypothetical protein